MIIEHGKEVETPLDNRISGDIVYNNSKVVFRGNGNILFADGKVTLKNSTISFCGDNAVLFLSGNGNNPYILKIDLWRETSAYFGAGSYFNGVLNAIISERRNIIVGSDGVFSFGLWLRTADPHLIYDAETHKRINPSKSIFIGDHVWLGQNALLLKGSRIGSGCVVSANCVLAGKSAGSNTVYAGNPGRKIKQGVFFLRDCVHNYTSAQTEDSMMYAGDEYIFSRDESTVSIPDLDEALTGAKDAEGRLSVIRRELAGNKGRNRFFVEPEKDKTGLFNRFSK